MISAIILLPLNVLVVIVAIILYFTDFNVIPGELSLAFIAMLIAFLVGLVLMIWTMALFARVKHGSPAPWNPINKLITTGPYAYTRNPMLTGVFSTLLGESLLFQSWPIFYYLIIFIVINTLYFKFIEEKSLARRYGQAYDDYKRKVPRFIPFVPPKL